MITLHAENGPMAPAALEAARRAGVATGLALGLNVLPETIEPYLDLVDMLLIMGTPMGVKGVKPSQHVFNRIKKTKAMVVKAGLEEHVKVFADGGIRENTVPKLHESGADGVIAGSLAFKSSNLEETFSWLHGLKKEVIKAE
jgi:ribulose-phosphate 3-epimerase